MVRYETRLSTHTVFFGELRDCLVCSLSRECAGARSRVQDPNRGRGKAIGFFKDVFKNSVQGTDYVRNNRLGCVVNTPALSFLWVVLGQERFVEVDDGIAPFSFL